MSCCASVTGAWKLLPCQARVLACGLLGQTLLNLALLRSAAFAALRRAIFSVEISLSMFGYGVMLCHWFVFPWLRRGDNAGVRKLPALKFWTRREHLGDVAMRSTSRISSLIWSASSGHAASSASPAA